MASESSSPMRQKWSAVRRTLAGALPSALGFTVASLATIVSLILLSRGRPAANWLVWDLGRIALATLLLNASMVVFGAQLFRWVLPRAKLPLAERLLWSFTGGLFGFALLMYALGALHLYSAASAAAIPLLLLAIGARQLPALWREVRQHFAEPLNSSAASRIVGGLATLAGGLGLGLLYLEALTPDSFDFDAIWYHIPIAQDYARLGGIVPFFGDNHRAYPHLASLLHTWALLVPGVEPLPLRWMLMLHLEFSMVVWRLVGALAVAQFLLRGRRVPGLWAVFFLFPSVFIYDQNIGGSADHVLGATAAPIALGLLRFLPRFALPWAVLTGIAAGLHILTKYQAIYLVAAVAVLSSLRALWFLWGVLGQRLGPKWRRVVPALPSGLLARHTVLRPLLVAAVALLVSSPHFIKNTVFYQNPLYPFGQKLLPPSFDDWKRPPEQAAGGAPLGTAIYAQIAPNQPSPSPQAPPAPQPSAAGKGGTPESRSAKAASAKLSRAAGKPRSSNKDVAKKADPYDFRFHSRSSEWSPQGDGLIERVVWIHRTIVEWPFLTANRNLTSQQPYMGGLFVLLLPVIFFTRKSKRTWGALAICYVALGVWAASSSNDRYLLTFLSIPIGVSGALLVELASLGRLSAWGASMLVGVQLLGAVRAPIRYGGDRLQRAVELVRRSESSKTPEQRYPYRAAQRRLSAALPSDAVVLGRYYKDLLGVDRTTLNTHANIQTYIPFDKLENASDLWLVCQDRGVTHLLYPHGKRQPTRAQEAILFDALFAETSDVQTMAGVKFAELPSFVPYSTKPMQVLVKGAREYEDGLYKVTQLSADYRNGRAKVRPRVPYGAEAMERLLSQAGAAYVGARGLSAPLREALNEQFEMVESFGSTEVWLKRP